MDTRIRYADKKDKVSFKQLTDGDIMPNVKEDYILSKTAFENNTNNNLIPVNKK